MVGRVIQVVLLCFVVGVILAAFNTDALGLLNWTIENFQKVIESARKFIDWGGHYILLGAGIVLPIVAINLIFKFIKKRRSSHENE